MSINLNLTFQHNDILTNTQVLVCDYQHFMELTRAGLQPYIELRYHSASSAKFWRVESTPRDGIIRRWGKIGTYGQSKSFGQKSAQQLIGEKIRKGYIRQSTAGHFPARITEVRSNGDLVELVSNGTVVWSDKPLKALQVLASCY